MYYFGCLEQPGHFFWSSDSRTSQKFVYFSDIPGGCKLNVDGAFTPMTSDAQGAAALVYKEGWTILAWHDYTCDKRPGANSALLVKGEKSFETMVVLLQQRFPAVYNRQPSVIYLA